MRKNGKSCYCTTEPKLSNESGKNENENIKSKKNYKAKGKVEKRKWKTVKRKVFFKITKVKSFLKSF